MKKLIFLVSLLSLIEAQAQDEGVLLSKYWNYRYALNGDNVAPSFRRWE